MQRHTNTVFMCSQDLWLMREREREKKIVSYRYIDFKIFFKIYMD